MNKIALITGGSKGLGKDMAMALAGKGYDIILTYNKGSKESEQVVSELEKMGGKAAALHLDISDIKSIDNFVGEVIQTLQSKWGTNKFDFLINNAGTGATVPIAQVTEALFDELMNIHFKGVYFLTQKTIDCINDHGAVIFISSGSTRFSVPGYSVYSSCKGAIEIFAKFVAKEYGSRGIRSNIVAPGPIPTDFNNAAIRNNPQRQTFLTAQTPLGRLGRADDIGSVVAFLCSDDAKWINGQRIEVSGGTNL